jgi:Ca2+-binding EF-hand superfamily protein
MKRTTALILALTGLASAQEGGPRPEAGGNRLGEMVKRLDTNADGKISKEEAIEGGKKDAESRFGQMDTNGDGVADEAEIRAVAEKMGNDRRGADGMRRPEGGDGGFRRPPEGQGRPEGGPRDGGPRPEGAPRDGGPRPEGAPRDGEGRPGPGGAGGFGAGGGMRGMMNPEEMIKSADKNADGALDLEEFRASRNKEVDESFKRMDGNGDGKVTMEEFRQIGERMRSMMGGMRDRSGPQGGAPGAGGFRRPGGEGGEGGGFRRPPSQEGGDKPAEAPKGV